MGSCPNSRNESTKIKKTRKTGSSNRDSHSRHQDVMSKHKSRTDTQTLGGTAKPGPVNQTVRNVWACRVPRSSETQSMLERSPADQVRSAWNSRFDSNLK